MEGMAIFLNLRVRIYCLQFEAPAPTLPILKEKGYVRSRCRLLKSQTMNTTATLIQHQNILDIQEFLDRAPRIQMSMIVNFNASETENGASIRNERVVENEKDKAISDAMCVSRERGIVVTGDVPSALKEGINAFFSRVDFDLGSQRFSAESLMRPIHLISAFFEGIKSFEKIVDYEVRFDKDRSSHRYGAVGYTIAITAVNSDWWSSSARNLWDSFIDLILDSNSPSVAVRLSEILPKWIEALLQIFQNMSTL